MLDNCPLTVDIILTSQWSIVVPNCRQIHLVFHNYAQNSELRQLFIQPLNYNDFKVYIWAIIKKHLGLGRHLL